MRYEMIIMMCAGLGLGSNICSVVRKKDNFFNIVYSILFLAIMIMMVCN